jgi:anti-anti-sigma factor
VSSHTSWRKPGETDGRFVVVVHREVAWTAVAPRGDLDLATVPILDAVLRAQTGLVVLDLRRLRFVDAHGLRSLTGAAADAATNGRQLRFIPGPAVTRLFDLLRLPDRLPRLAVVPALQGTPSAGGIRKPRRPWASRARAARPHA